MNALPNVGCSMEAVLITDDLRRRPAKRTSDLRQKKALQELAMRMAYEPQAVLPKFVELAMELTGGVSAGLSLYESDPAPGVFRWRHLHGLLSPFDGATTPRNNSPCGVTLDCNAPVLMAAPERVYDWISDADIEVPEVLLVPLHIEGREPLGTLWIVSDKPGHFNRGHSQAMVELASFVGVAVRMMRNGEALQRALQEQETVAREMSHRVKNLFAMTDGMIRMSARNAATKEELAESLSGRLHAMATAHSLVRRNFGDIGGSENASDLRELIATIVRPYEHAAGRLRFSLDGPQVSCGDHAVNGVALVFHELATNAAKYGALKVDTGRVAVEWRVDSDAIVLHWAESGGPTVPGPPTATGFGSTLAQTTIVRQFRGKLDYDWRPEGLAVTVTLPRASLAH